MQRIPDAGRAAPLVLELSSGTAILHGEGVELPLREFRLLAALARRVGEPVSSTDLIEAIWPEEPWTPKEDLYVLASKLRRLIDGPTKFGKNIRNRRGFGYMLDLDPSEVVVIESGTQGHRIINIDEPENRVSDAEATETFHADTPTDEEPVEAVVEEAPPTSRPRGLRLAGITALVLIFLAGSWSAGYVLSRLSRSESRDETNAAESNPGSRPTAAAQQDAQRTRAGKDGRSKAKDRKKKKKNSLRGNSGSAVAGTVGTGGTSGGSVTNQDPSQDSQGSRKGSKKQASEPTLPPAPTRYLYHLVNEQSGDHFVTTDGNTASEYQAMGYEGGAIARVYTYKEDGTEAISTNHGTAYIFINPSAKTQPASRTVPLWYSTDGDGDFFYTTNESEARQSGWQGSVIGYARSL